MKWPFGRYKMTAFAIVLNASQVGDGTTKLAAFLVLTVGKGNFRHFDNNHLGCGNLLGPAIKVKSSE